MVIVMVNCGSTGWQFFFFNHCGGQVSSFLLPTVFLLSKAKQLLTLATIQMASIFPSNSWQESE